MNSLISSLFATGATAAVALAVIGLPNSGPGVAVDEITGSIAGSRQGDYLLVSGGSECRVRRGARIAPTVYRFETLGKCDALPAGANEAEYWTETSSGGIVISGGKGVVIEFAQADGAQFESIFPSRPRYTMTRGTD